MICAAKFPKKVEVAAYTQIRKPLRNALSKPNFDKESLEFLASRMDAKSLLETGYNKDEALRCAKAIRAFSDTFSAKKLSRYDIAPCQTKLTKTISGVKVNVSLDAMVTEAKDDFQNSGGIILLYAFSANRNGVKDRLATASGLILWALEGGQMQPLPRLCMAVDLAEHNIVKASASHDRLRQRITASCAEIAAQWDSIEPPHDYDGPDWR